MKADNRLPNIDTHFTPRRFIGSDGASHDDYRGRANPFTRRGSLAPTHNFPGRFSTHTSPQSAETIAPNTSEKAQSLAQNL